MRSAIRCRLKFTLLLILFALPILVAMWNQSLDESLRATRYLEPLNPQAVAFTDESCQ